MVYSLARILSLAAVLCYLDYAFQVGFTGFLAVSSVALIWGLLK